MKISLNNTLRAMSIALDLAEMSSFQDSHIYEQGSNISYSANDFLHHSVITTYIALEIGRHLKIERKSYEKLYIASMIHDIGATTDEIDLSHKSEDFILRHCIKGASIVSSFPVFHDLSHIIKNHHENWDGSGYMRLSKEDIPIESQIIRIADLIAVQFDQSKPIYVQRLSLNAWVKKNARRLFSTKLADAFLHLSEKDIFWFNIKAIPNMNFILDDIAPDLNIYLNLDEFEKIALVFAKIIDKKSSFTARHSRDIAELAYKVSKKIGYSDEKCRKMKIAGLFHDIGKLAISSKVLDKNGTLTDEEFSDIKSHTYYTKIILDRMMDIPDISDWASNHHEKLNGKGYPRGLTDAELTEESRILGVCDIYQALTEDRPYRNGLSMERAFSIIDNMANEGFICRKAVQYLKETLGYEYLNEVCQIY